MRLGRTLGLRQLIIRTILAKLPEKILVNVKKYHYAHLLRNVAETDEIDFKVIKNLVSCGDHVIDVGANVGVYTKYLSDLVGINGKVYSIEPIPLTFDILSSNVKKLKLGNASLFECAISDADREVTMEVPLYDSGWENFYQARIIYEDSGVKKRRVIVNSKTLDGLFSKLAGNISFIKCDVEGHELQCVRGANKIIMESKPAWLIELSGDPDKAKSAAHEMLRVLREKGYDAFWFDGKKLKKRCYGDKSVNYFFLSKNHLHLLKLKGFSVDDELEIRG